MPVLDIIVALFGILPFVCHGLVSETIVDTNLIGDHFGVPSTNATFDYVVVGGGTAGLALATRLAVNGTYTVAVVEAGDFYEEHNGNYSSVPAMSGHFIGTAPATRNPSIDWYYQTEPSEGFGGRSIVYNSGKTLGGSSARNSMIYARATNSTYHMWAQQVNDSSYEFENFLPYYQRSLTFDPPNMSTRLHNATIGTNPPGIGTEQGPLHATLPAWANAASTYVTTALNSLGLQQLEGVVDGALLGYTFVTSTINGHTQTRSSAESSYLRWGLVNTDNLVVYVSTLAEKLLFDGQGCATGVKVNTAGISYNLTARQEVILSAGAIRSPQLLMLSGIGPRHLLESLDIPVLVDAPGVGQNMFDSAFFGPSYPVNVTTHTALTTDPSFAAKQTELYHANRTGMLTNPGFDVITWEKIPDSLRSDLSDYTQSSLNESFPADWPELQTTFVDAFSGYVRDKTVGALNGAPNDKRMYMSILPGLTATFSRGNITINSTDPSHYPVIHPAVLNDIRDQEQAIAANKRARQIAQTDAMQQIIVGDEVFPGLNVTTDKQILDIILQSATTFWHASCTCKMGTKDDPMAVVDTQGRVKGGVQRLRVVDASIFPFLVPNHPSATVYALAEKIADQIISQN